MFDSIDDKAFVGHYEINVGDLKTLNPGNELAEDVMEFFLRFVVQCNSRILVHKIVYRQDWECSFKDNDDNFIVPRDWKKPRGIDKVIYPYNVDGNYLLFIADMSEYHVYLFDSTGLFKEFQEKQIILNSVNSLADAVEINFQELKFFNVEMPTQTKTSDSGVHMCIQAYSIIETKSICSTEQIESSGRLFILSKWLQNKTLKKIKK